MHIYKLQDTSPKLPWNEHKIKRAKYFPTPDEITRLFCEHIRQLSPHKPLFVRTPTPDTEEEIPLTPRPPNPSQDPTQQLRNWLMPNPPQAVAKKIKRLRAQRKMIASSPKQPPVKPALNQIEVLAITLLQASKTTQQAAERTRRLSVHWDQNPDESEDALVKAINAFQGTALEFAQQEEAEAQQHLKQLIQDFRKLIPPNESLEKFTRKIFPEDPEAAYALQQILNTTQGLI